MGWVGPSLTCYGVPVQVVEHVAQAEDGGGCSRPAAQAGWFGLLCARALGSGCAAWGAGSAGGSGRGPSHTGRQRLHLIVGGRDSSGARCPRPAATTTASSSLRPPAPAPPLRVRLLLLRAARRRRGAFQAHHAGRDRGGGGRGGRGAQLGPTQCVCAPRSRCCTIPAGPRRLLRSGPGCGAATVSARCTAVAAEALTAAVRPRPPGLRPISPGLGPQPRPARAAPGGGGGCGPQSPSRPMGAQSRRSCAAAEAGEDPKGVCGELRSGEQRAGSRTPQHLLNALPPDSPPQRRLGES